MKGLRFSIGVILLFTQIRTLAQASPVWQCADEKLESLQRRANSRFDEIQKKTNEQLKEYIQNSFQNKKKPVFNGRPMGDSVYTIPVVVHLMHPQGEKYGTGSNISYFQIRSQLEALNAAFAKNYPAYNSQSHPGYSVDTKIRFCLARSAMPDTANWSIGPGGIEYGVRRYPVDATVFNHDISNASAAKLLSITHPGSKHFPFENYLNIWLVKSIGANSIMGYAPRPLTNGYPLDGVVMRADIFGDNTGSGNYPLGFGLEQGKVLAHEVGHYLNLYHIFQGACAGANPAGAATDACDLNGDFICDIKPTSVQNVFCDNTIYNTCPVNYTTGTTQTDMINNYMSYADDDCMNTFTPDQAKRMWATLNMQRHALWQPDNLAATGVLGTGGCIPAYLNALISTNTGVYCAERPIVFSNPSSGNTATRYQWSFPGGSPATANNNTATVSYATPGNYKAFLTVSDGTNTLTDSLLIPVVTCNLDSSMKYMSHWYFGDFCSLDFSTGAPVLTTTALDHNTIKGESSYTGQLPYVNATISLSDSTGNLLFYSNGVSMWNGLHQKITTSPMFGSSDINASSGICYIPYPGKPGKYFIAGVYPNFNEDPSGVRFVLVDVNANSVGSYQEFNHPSLPSRFSQYLTVVPHCNGTDYWIITKGHATDKNFYSFLVTANGIDKTQSPVISTGFAQPGFGGSGYQLKANREGNRLVMTSPNPYTMKGFAALYSFDNRTGLLANERIVPDVAGYNNVQTGVAFSPNGEYFYIFRSSHPLNLPPYWLFQYRVNDFQYNIVATSGHYFGGSFQPGPDNQLYAINGYNYLARISNPDKWSEAVFDGEFINFFQAGHPVRSGQSSIPAFIDARQPMPRHPEFSSKAIACNTYEFSSLCFDNYNATWDFGDGSPLEDGHSIRHTYLQAGEYEVKLFLSKSAIIVGSATTKIIVLPLAVNITGPGTVCTNSLYADQYFAPVLNGVDYKWTAINGSVAGPDNMSFADIKWNTSQSNGTVNLAISKENCIVNASMPVGILAGPSFSWTIKDSVCISDTAFELRARPLGGTFTGPGVLNNYFSPTIAGIGTHKLTYTYRDEQTCPGRIEKIVKVKNCVSPPESVCEELFSGIRILPNIVTDILEIRFPYVMKYDMTIYNTAGQQIITGGFNNNKIKVSNLAAGMYLAVIYCGTGNYFRAYRFFKY